VADRILVVTGARSLADTPAAKAWAHDRLIAAFAWWEPALLIHGGCCASPDEWAHQIAECPELIYFANGRLDDEAGDPHGSWLLAGDVASPLLRNRRMMQGAIRHGAGCSWWAHRTGARTGRARARARGEHGLRIARRAMPAEPAGCAMLNADNCTPPGAHRERAAPLDRRPERAAYALPQYRIAGVVATKPSAASCGRDPRDRPRDRATGMLKSHMLW
jgi:hypothetical protein